MRKLIGKFFRLCSNIWLCSGLLYALYFIVLLMTKLYIGCVREIKEVNPFLERVITADAIFGSFAIILVGFIPWGIIYIILGSISILIYDSPRTSSSYNSSSSYKNYSSYRDCNKTKESKKAKKSESSSSYDDFSKSSYLDVVSAMAHGMSQEEIFKYNTGDYGTISKYQALSYSIDKSDNIGFG